jgi:hypothetical protein
MKIKLKNDRRVIEYDGTDLVEECYDDGFLRVAGAVLDSGEVEELIGALRCWLNIGRLPMEEVGTW